MDWSRYREMDPNLLYSLVNTKLRNDFDDLEDLARTLELDPAVIEQRLAGAGYRYDAGLNQFRRTD